MDPDARALQLLLDTIVAEFPSRVFPLILLKSMTAVHPHRIACRAARRPPNDVAHCFERVKYMSASRARRTYEIERDVVRSPRFAKRVRLLPQYELTEEGDREGRRGDGRHYEARINNELWSKAFTVIP